MTGKKQWSFLAAMVLVFGSMSSSVNAAKGQGAEDLLFMDIPTVTATLTSIDEKKIPASVTTITADQIAMTPARNIYDLLEIYVPGALWVTHHESPHVGIRGIISDRNYKMLVLVNGRKMNQNAHSGAEAELEQWDLNDIKKIEIIRGPGSVTYGPGAIESVINIITKNAEDAKGLTVGVQYVSNYNSKGLYLSDGIVNEKYKLYLYGSVVGTTGIAPKEYYVTTTAQYGYLGESDSLGNRKPLDYLNDAGGKPQVKLHAELDFMKEFKVWMRYTNFGTSRHGSPYNMMASLSSGQQIDLKENQDRAFVAAVENIHTLSDMLTLQSMLSWSSLDHQRRDNNGVSNIAADTSDENSMRNIIQAFSENELLGRALLNYTWMEKYKFAGGVEYSLDTFGPGWGDSSDKFRMGDASNIFSDLTSPGNTTTGNAVNVAANKAYAVGNGWTTSTLSFLLETNLEFDKKLDLILSGRTDKNTYTNTLFSPRVALISDWENLGITKLIWQKSLRMNTGEQLKLNDAVGRIDDPEQLVGYEFIYDLPKKDKFSLSTSLFYNELDILGWSSASWSTVNIGKVNIYGVELDSKYKTSEKLTLGASQTYTKQKDFKLADGQTRSGISYSDYNITTGGLHFAGTGNDLNNWANFATKLYADYTATPKWTFHGDARIFWKFEGYLDGLTMVDNANNTAASAAVSDIRSHNTFNMDARLDASARYAFTDNLSATLYILNLLGVNENKRYTYDTGVNNAAPNRVSWIEEPRVFGVKVESKF